MDAAPTPSAIWRLVMQRAPAPGAYNLALDEALLKSVAAGLAPPTLRLYTWQPSVVLGRGQPLAEADREAITARGYALLRRPTGGTAVFHGEGLTYSVLLPRTDPHAVGDVVTSYRRLSRPLLHALEALGATGIEARAHEENRRRRSPVCFEISSAYEITVGGRKVVGNAQLRTRTGLLHHGTLPLSGDIGHIAMLLTSRPDPARVRRHATTLAEALERPIGWQEVAEALRTGFTTALNVTLEPGALLLEERMLADRLVTEKYAHPQWTGRL